MAFNTKDTSVIGNHLAHYMFNTQLGLGTKVFAVRLQ